VQINLPVLSGGAPVWRTINEVTAQVIFLVWNLLQQSMVSLMKPPLNTFITAIFVVSV